MIDCDKVAHECYAPHSNLVKIIEKSFPGENLREWLPLNVSLSLLGTTKNGVVDRKALGAVVFNNKVSLHFIPYLYSSQEKRLQLNALIWPEVLKKVEERISQVSLHSLLSSPCLFKAPSSSILFIEAAALVEAGWHTQLNETWTVFCARDEELQRVMKRDSLDKQQVHYSSIPAEPVLKSSNRTI